VTACGCRASLGLDSRGRLPPQEHVLILYEGRERFGAKRRPAYQGTADFFFFFFGLDQVSDNYPRAADEEKRLLLTSSFYRTSQKSFTKTRGRAS
jgi:hypothetical protein